jgi:DNA-binding transcriptional LysR family regulator
MKITLKQLLVFTLTAKHKSISTAAKLIPITQAAASMSLSQLESALNQQLFEREGKKLILNSAGSSILAKANAILDNASEIESSIATKQSIAGNLHIGASTTIANNILPKILNTFSKLYPDVTITLSAMNTEECINNLLHYQVDVALIEGLTLNSQIEAQPWLSDYLTVFCHPKHPLAKKRSIKLNDLENYPWLMRETSSGTRQVFEAALIKQPINLGNITVINSSLAIKNIVKENPLALSCLSERVIADDVAQKTLVALKIKEWDLQRYFYHARHKEKIYSQVSKLFIQKLLEVKK